MASPLDRASAFWRKATIFIKFSIILRPFPNAYQVRSIDLSGGHPFWEDGNSGLPVDRGRLLIAIPQRILDTVAMNSDEAKMRAQQLFKQPGAIRPNGSAPVPDYEARSRDIRQKIEYLRSLRLAAQARGRISSADGATD